MRSIICFVVLCMVSICHAGEAGRVAVLAARARFELEQRRPKRVELGTTPVYQIVNGVPHHTSDAHLIHDHGYSAEDLKGLSQAQKDLLHGHAHGFRVAGKTAVRLYPTVEGSQAGPQVHPQTLGQQRAIPQPSAAQGPVYQTQCNGRSCRRVRIR